MSRLTPSVEVKKPIPPEDLLPIEELAKRLHQTVAWVREKCRRRCPNPIPVYNLGRHLLFDWTQVSEWIRSSPRPVHASHKRRWRKKPQEEKERLHVVKKVAA